VNATVQWDEPWNPNGSTYTVWYSWTATREADVTFTVPAGFSLARFTGSYFNQGAPGSITFRTYPGIDYLLSVDGGPGPFTLSWAYSATGPANDYRAEAQVLEGLDGSVSASTVGATAEPSEPRHDGSAGENTGHSIWYRWTAPATGTAIFTTQGSSFDTQLRAYVESWDTLVGRGWYLPDLNPWTTWSRVELDVQAGDTYWFAVDGQDGATGDVELSWRTAQAGEDWDAPTVELWSPESGSTVSGTITLLADADDDQGVDRVEYFIAPNGLADGPWLVGEALGPPYDVALDTSVLDPGVYSVYARAFDAAGNSSSSGYTITVSGAQPPTLTVPKSIVVEATKPDGAPVKFSASAHDYKGVGLTVTCTPRSGSLFPMGTTTVSCSTADSYGNRVTKTFTITVRDTTPPALTVPEQIVVNAVAPSGAPVGFEATAVDRGVAIAPVCAPVSGDTFAVGDATVECTATDAWGNSSSATFSVHVKGADEQLAELRDVVAGLGVDKLLAQIDDVRKQFEAKRQSAVCGGLADFADLASRESDRRLTADQAGRLVANATRIRAVVGC